MKANNRTVPVQTFMKLVFKACICLHFANHLFEANRRNDNILIHIPIPDPDYKNVLPWLKLSHF